jgi:hypothetical protein
MDKKEGNVEIGNYEVKIVLRKVSAGNDALYVFKPFLAKITINSGVYPIAYG